MFSTTPSSLPTLYQYYAEPSISSGLSVTEPNFTLNNRTITIYSGSMHYFRIPRRYWRDRLRKLRAAGLNTVETYVPWNLHEPSPHNFDFGNGTSEWSSFLDLQEYLRIAQEEDLFVIVRPGPYICAQWEFGGFPSWLLQYPGLKLRTSEPQYIHFVKRYFNELLPLLDKMQFTKGGPIIAFQVETSYASCIEGIDLDYIKQLFDIMTDNGLVELLVSSDLSEKGKEGTIPELFQTINFTFDPNGNLDNLKEMQPNQPLMVMEFARGYFDRWTSMHLSMDLPSFEGMYEMILKYPSSVNIYMFHGGTNFGFMNGARTDLWLNLYYEPVTSSYDHGAPLSEAGDYTEKYWIVKNLIQKYSTVKTLTPDPPPVVPLISYPSISIQKKAPLKNLLERTVSFSDNKCKTMEELLQEGRGCGQSYGYVSYKTEGLDLPANSELTIEQFICDTVMVLINDVPVSQPLVDTSLFDRIGFWRQKNSTFLLTETDLSNATLTILVENFGRGHLCPEYAQTKGLKPENALLLNGKPLVVDLWTMNSLEFDRDFNINFDNWSDLEDTKGPALYKATLTLEEEPSQDSFIEMCDWKKGIVIVNGFVLGRYLFLGPQQALYLPAPFLHKGDNDILVFEHFESEPEIRFSAEPVFFNAI